MAAGAHAVTVSADLLDSMLALPQVSLAVDAFADDFREAFGAAEIA